MDEQLRQLERGEDRVAYALALRRLGDETRARRVLEAALRAGDLRAKDVLDQIWPIDDVERRVARALETRPARETVCRDTLVWLLVDEDPRVDGALARLADVIESRVLQRMDGWQWVVEASRLPALERRRLVLSRGDALPLSMLARARPDETEAAALLERAAADSAVGFLVVALWHAGRAHAMGTETALRTHAQSRNPVVAFEAVSALARLGVVVPVPRPTLLPPRPAWFPDACPTEIRDRVTGALGRHYLYERASPPLSWVLYVELDDASRLLDFYGESTRNRLRAEVTGTLQSVVGDRLYAWHPSAFEWLARLEPERDGPAVAEALRAAVASTSVPDDHGAGVPVTVSIGVARGAEWFDAVIPAQRALDEAKTAGHDRDRVAVFGQALSDGGGP